MGQTVKEKPQQDRWSVGDAGTLASCYRLIGELLLYPQERDQDRIEANLEALDDAPEKVREAVQKFLAAPRSQNADEYIDVLELDAPCPLYAGAYIFDEPKSCRGVGMSGRNAYMLEVGAVYKHYGLDASVRDLADFLPMMVEFLGLSLDRPDRDKIGLRRRFVEQYFQPALAPLIEKLEKFETPYAELVKALAVLAEEDLVTMFDHPVWVPPADSDKRPFQSYEPEL